MGGDYRLVIMIVDIDNFDFRIGNTNKNDTIFAVETERKKSVFLISFEWFCV
jgi:hypothetical protein